VLVVGDAKAEMKESSPVAIKKDLKPACVVVHVKAKTNSGRSPLMSHSMLAQKPAAKIPAVKADYIGDNDAIPDEEAILLHYVISQLWRKEKQIVEYVIVVE